MQLKSPITRVRHTLASARHPIIAAVKKTGCLIPSIRYREVLILQGPPLMGMVFSLRAPIIQAIATAMLSAVANSFLIAHIWTLNDWADLDSDSLDRNKQPYRLSRNGIDPSSMLWFSIPTDHSHRPL